MISYNIPYRIDRHIRCRHGRRSHFAPTLEGVTGSGRGRSRRDTRAVRVSDLRAIALFRSPYPAEPVAVSGVVILHHQRSVRLDGHLLRHRSSETFEILHRGSYFGIRSSGQFLRQFRQIILTIPIQDLQIVLNAIFRVLVRLPVRLQRQISDASRRNGAHHRAFAIRPVQEGISCSGRRRQGDFLRLNTVDDITDRVSAVRIKGDRVVDSLPDRRDRHISRRHLRRDLRIPTLEDITLLGGICRCSHRSHIILRDRCHRTSANGIEGNRVLIDLPLCHNGDVLCRHRRGQCRQPANKGIAFLRRRHRSHHGRLIILRIRNDR